MYIQFAPDENAPGKYLIEIGHGNKKMHWYSREYDKTELMTSQSGAGTRKYDAFAQINAYWASLPDKQQGEIFQFYEDIYPVLHKGDEGEKIIDAAKPMIAEFLDKHHAFEDVRRFMDVRGINVPPQKFKDTVTESSVSPITASKTYTREDYRNLVTLAVILRTMIPIWSEFMYYIKKNVMDLMNSRKDYDCYRLLRGSRLLESEAIRKLDEYIRANLEVDSQDLKHILEGFSSQDFPIRVMGAVLVRRVAIANIDGVDAETSIVTFVYYYLPRKSQLKRRGSGPSADRIRDLKNPSGKDSDDENGCVLEWYRIIAKNSIGDLAVDRATLRSLQTACEAMLPGVSKHFIRVAQRAVERIPATYAIPPFQVDFVRNVLVDVISPSSYGEIQRADTLNAMAIATAYLLATGQYMLAIITSGYAQVSDEAQMDHRKLPREVVEELDRLYHFKIKENSRTQAKIVNPAVETINLLSTGFKNIEWINNIDFTQIEMPNGAQHFMLSQAVISPPNIRLLLANFFIRRNEWNQSHLAQ